NGLSPSYWNTYASNDVTDPSQPTTMSDVVASAGGNGNVDNRALLNADKASYQQGDFNGYDVTKKGDTLEALFIKNYGYVPSHAELVQYGNYNNLTDAHDVSVNREIISPSLEALKNTPSTPEQLQSFDAKDAAYAAQKVADQKAAEFKDIMASWRALDGTQA